MSRALPSFDLVVATVGRTEELDRLLESLAGQDYPSLRVIVVDQNEDERLVPLVSRTGLLVEHVRAPRGLSRARNVGLALVEADVVAFPDDDCTYPPGVLTKVGDRLAADTTLDGLTGRVEDESGGASASWKHDSALLGRTNLWNRVNAATTFLRRDLVERVGPFDERLGLGSPDAWASGEEVDYLIRAVDAGARVEYDPSLVVRHAIVPDDPRIGYRDGATVGYLLRKHSYSAPVVTRMLVRPIGGAMRSLARLDGSAARYQAATLRGRLRGYVRRS